MENKGIYIDGVDVADCEHINACDKKMKCVILQDDVCEINPYCEGFNCYYKQLKAKEKECDRLKDIIETKLEDANICDSALNYINDEYIYVKQQLDKLKAENDELKKKVYKYEQAEKYPAAFLWQEGLL